MRLVFPQGITHADAVIAHVEDPDAAVPDSVVDGILKVFIGRLPAFESARCQRVMRDFG